MAKAKSTKNAAVDGQMTGESVEPMVIALAEQLGTFLGRAQAKADGWLENDALRQQLTQIRDGATQLLNRVNRASVVARKAVAKPAAKKTSAKSAANPKGRSGGAVDAQGKLSAWQDHFSASQGTSTCHLSVLAKKCPDNESSLADFNDRRAHS